LEFDEVTTMARSVPMGLTAVAIFGLAALNPLQAQSPPLIRVGTPLVEVDVVVRDKDGPVRGLKQDDFTLLDRGEKQSIALFQAGALRAEASPSTAAQAALPLPAGVVSNRIDRSGQPIAGATALLVDLLNTSFDNQGYARSEVLKYLESAPKGERTAIYMLGRDLTVIQDFTDDASALLRAAKKWDPGNLFVLIQNTENMDAIDRANADNPLYAQIRHETTAQAIAKIAQRMSEMPGRKSLVWLSDTPGVAGGQFLGATNIHLYPVLARAVGTSGVVGWLRDKREAGTAAGATPALGGGDELAQEHANAALAAANGGVAFMDSSKISLAIQTAMEDTETDYVLGFYPAEDHLDNKLHALTVTVGKNGPARSKNLEIRYRPGYLATRKEPAAAPQNGVGANASATASARPAKDRPTLEQLLKDPTDLSQVDVTVEPAPDLERPGFMKVKVKIDPRDLALKHENARRTGLVDVSFYVPKSGKVVTKTLRVDVPDSEYDVLIENGIETVESIDIAGQLETLRVVVQDQTTGAAGTLTVRLGMR
jgi:VWFA-related protein